MAVSTRAANFITQKLRIQKYLLSELSGTIRHLFFFSFLLKLNPCSCHRKNLDWQRNQIMAAFSFNHGCLNEKGSESRAPVLIFALLPLTLELHRKKPDSNQSVSLARNVYTYQKREKCVSIVTWSIRCVREKSELCSISFCVWHGSINVPIFVNTKTSEKIRREKLQNPLSHSFLLRTRRSLLNHRSTTVLYSIFNGQYVRKQKRAWLWVNGVKFDLVSPCPVFYFGCEMNWREEEWGWD